MKKVVISICVVVMFIFLVGCLDYKAYEIPKEEDTKLVDEIAAIEEELNLENTEAEEETTEEVLEEELPGWVEEEIPEEVEEEVVLPELTEETVAEEKDLMIMEVNENEAVKLKVKVSDPDKDEVTYTFTPPLDSQGYWKTNYGDAGEYLVTLKATDGKLITERPIKVVVKRVNVPPVIEPLKDLQVKEGETVVLEPKVTDPNEDPVTVKINEPLKSGTWTTDHTSEGEYQIKVTATDGEMASDTTFMLRVSNVNVKPEINGLEDIIVKEGETVKIEPVIVDLDEDEIELSISDPVGSDGVWETGYTEHGEYSITVSAFDGKDRVSKKVKVVVEDVNMPPEIVDVYVEVN